MNDVVVLAAAAALPWPWSLMLQGLIAVLVVWGSYQVTEAWWLRPRRLDLALRAQGLSGTEYRFPAGDLQEHGRLNDDERSKPMNPGCHDVVPRVMPHLFNTVKEHGTNESPPSPTNVFRLSTPINCSVQYCCKYVSISWKKLLVFRREH